ncbi:hypothetical protein V1508DRAFT_361575 [Lipomyces doorenjongii]|uniref:uncharacterized protein n=1 Tax=Lipomyces doorenjongii TaxID=383834 RepID=UPI0034CF234C
MSSIDKYRVDITSLRSECESTLFSHRWLSAGNTNAASIDPVTLLSRKRAQLASRLAYLKSSKAVFSRPGPEATQSLLSDELLERDRERGKLLLAHLSEKYDEQQNIHLQNLYRLAGVTAFKVRDPSANGKGDLLGIRIECFALSMITEKFGAPHYILLSVDGKTNSYDIYKYTVPLHIPLASLAKKYLHKDLGVCCFRSSSYPKVLLTLSHQAFVRAVRKEIILDVNKRTHLSCLSNVVAIEADDACELVKLEFAFPKYGACIAYLRCNMVDIKSAVVTKFVQKQADDPDMDHEFQDEERQTVRDEKLEALMPGRIDQLCVRLATIE